MGGTCITILGQEHCSEKYCFDCELHDANYWCSKSVPQPHECCYRLGGKPEIKDSDNGDVFPSVGPDGSVSTEIQSLTDCLLFYGICVENVAKYQENYNGCALSKNVQTTQSLPVIHRRTFTDAATCWQHLGACGYTKFSWQVATGWCLSQ